MKRREFLVNAGGLACIGAMAQLMDGCSQTSVSPRPSANFSIDLTNAAYSALKTVGGVVFYQGVYIVRASTTSYIALSQVCTHAGCSVTYSSSNKQFYCPCHGGTFDSSGTVLSGPPPSPLAQYAVTVNGNTLSVSG